MFVPRLLQEEGEKEEAKPLCAHFGAAALVILGDPGAGKTELFRQASQEEGGRLLTIRQFLRQPIPGPMAQPIYLDALDEVRAQSSNGHTVLDQVIGKLVRLGKPKLRLSCRATDWFGGLDSNELSEASDDGKVRALSLLPLTVEDIQIIVAAHGIEAATFMKRAQDDGILDWLDNPQTLMLLLAVLEEGRSWPETRQELFARACEVLVREPNETHARSSRGELPTDDLLRAGGQLCATHLIAGTAGFALVQTLAEADFPFLTDVALLGSSQELLHAVARRRLFRNDGAERIVPTHRTIAEYLSARFLIGQVRKGLPVKRVLALITASDGGVPTELRGLFAWFTCLASEYSELLLEKDPLAVVLYGDVAALSASARAQLLRELRVVAERDPYFESGTWSAREFSPFACHELESELRELLQSRHVPWRLTAKVLAALKLSRSQPAFGELLLKIARDPKRVPAVTELSVQAFCELYPERTEDLLALLDEIDGGAVQDANDQGRHALLKALFPKAIGPRRVVQYLYPAHPEIVSTFTHRFLRSELLELLSEEDLPEFLDALVERGLPGSQELLHCIAPLMSGALAQGLEKFGKTIPIPQLNKWLGLSLVNTPGLVQNTRERQQHLERIRHWFEEHPVSFRKLFQFNLHKQSWRSYYHFSHEFGNRCPDDPPIGFGHDLLELASEVEDERLAHGLFREAVQLAVEEGRAGEPTVADFHLFTKQHPRFAEVWEKARVSKLAERLESALEERQRQEQLERQKQENIHELQKRADAIEAGQDWQALVWLAHKYFNFRRDSELQDLEPLNRLLHTVGKELTETALLGFVCSILSPGQPSPEELGESVAQNTIPGQPYPVLAGLSLLYEQDPEKVLRLPAEALANCIVYSLVCPELFDRNSAWFVRILDACPAECTTPLMEFWRPPLSARKPDLPGLHRLTARPELGLRVCLQLLEEFPRPHPRALEELLLTSLELDNREEILHLARKQLKKPQGLRTEQYLLWLGAAFVLDSTTYASALLKHAPQPLRSGSDTKRAGKLRRFIAAAFERNEDLREGFSVRGIETMIIAFTKAFPHHPHFDSMGDEFEVPSWVHRLIEKLGSRADDEANEILTGLCHLPVMEPWRDRLRHTLELQVRNRRELSFQQPTFAQVLETLKGGRPTNTADLFALVCDHLKQISDEIRNAASDGYKSFWNLDSHERPQSLLPEGTCRDRLTERLRQRLRPLDINVEREADHADHKRADLRITYGTMAVPIECKRHDNRELWLGISTQLIPRYSRTPESSGHGIYVVFWFGLDAKKIRARRPSGIENPTSADGLEESLRALITRDNRDRITVLCIDVSRRNE